MQVRSNCPPQPRRQDSSPKLQKVCARSVLLSNAGSARNDRGTQSHRPTIEARARPNRLRRQRKTTSSSCRLPFVFFAEFVVTPSSASFLPFYVVIDLCCNLSSSSSDSPSSSVCNLRSPSSDPSSCAPTSKGPLISRTCAPSGNQRAIMGNETGTRLDRRRVRTEGWPTPVRPIPHTHPSRPWHELEREPTTTNFDVGLLRAGRPLCAWRSDNIDAVLGCVRAERVSPVAANGAMVASLPASFANAAN